MLTISKISINMVPEIELLGLVSLGPHPCRSHSSLIDFLTTFVSLLTQSFCVGKINSLSLPLRI